MIILSLLSITLLLLWVIGYLIEATCELLEAGTVRTLGIIHTIRARRAGEPGIMTKDSHWAGEQGMSGIRLMRPTTRTLHEVG